MTAFLLWVCGGLLMFASTGVAIDVGKAVGPNGKANGTTMTRLAVVNVLLVLGALCWRAA